MGKRETIAVYVRSRATNYYAYCGNGLGCCA